MLINEIVVVEKFEFDRNKLKDIKLNNVTYKWNKARGAYMMPNGDEVDERGSLFTSLVKHPDNRASWINVSDYKDRRLRKGVVGGTVSKLADLIGISGVGQKARSNPKAGIGQKTGAVGGAIVGRAIDSLANFFKSKMPKKGPRDEIDDEFDKRGWKSLKDPVEAPERTWKAGDKDDRKVIRWVKPQSPKNTVGSKAAWENAKLATKEYNMKKVLGPVYDLPFLQKQNHPMFIKFMKDYQNSPLYKSTPQQGFENPFYNSTISNKKGYSDRLTKITNPKAHPFTAGGQKRVGTGAQGQGFLPDDPVDRQRWLNMQDSAKGIEFLKGQVRSKNITIDQAGEVIQFVKGEHPSQEVKQPTTFQKAWRMWYVTSPQYKQQVDAQNKEKQKIQRQVDQVKQDNEKIRAQNQQMPLNQRTPRKSFILGPDGKPASI